MYNVGGGRSMLIDGCCTVATVSGPVNGLFPVF